MFSLNYKYEIYMIDTKKHPSIDGCFLYCSYEWFSRAYFDYGNVL